MFGSQISCVGIPRMLAAVRFSPMLALSIVRPGRGVLGISVGGKEWLALMIGGCSVEAGVLMRSVPEKQYHW